MTCSGSDCKVAEWQEATSLLLLLMMTSLLLPNQMMECDSPLVWLYSADQSVSQQN